MNMKCRDYQLLQQEVLVLQLFYSRDLKIFLHHHHHLHLLPSYHLDLLFSHYHLLPFHYWKSKQVNSIIELPGKPSVQILSRINADLCDPKRSHLTSSEPQCPTCLKETETERRDFTCYTLGLPPDFI